MSDLNQMDKLPMWDKCFPPFPCSETVTLVYPDGKTFDGWFDMVVGWMRMSDGDGIQDVDDDNPQPLGWRRK